MLVHPVKNLLVICGPTATGKTKLAVHLAKTLGGEVISADSRQVYRGLDIGTGKDVHLAAKIWGYDLVDPGRVFSVAQYRLFALNIIRHFLKAGILPILTGGTGLYIKAVVDGIATVNIPQNPDLRRILADKRPEELFESLAQMDALKAAAMNYSDKHNPRRLVRAIEIATWKIDNQDKDDGGRGLGFSPDQVLFIGLTAPLVYLKHLIGLRVERRIAEGVEEEIRNLLSQGIAWETQAMTSLGYRQWQGFFEGKISREAAISLWKNEEIKYMHRQVTWFKNNPRIIWIDISKHGYEEKVEGMVKKWYYSD